MKIIEEIIRDEEHLYSKIKFTIIGDRKENSMEIPMWQKILCVSDEMAREMTSNNFKQMKLANAMDVFDKYYRDTFITP